MDPSGIWNTSTPMNARSYILVPHRSFRLPLTVTDEKVEGQGTAMTFLRGQHSYPRPILTLISTVSSIKHSTAPAQVHFTYFKIIRLIVFFLWDVFVTKIFIGEPLSTLWLYAFTVFSPQIYKALCWFDHLSRGILNAFDYLTVLFISLKCFFTVIH